MYVRVSVRVPYTTCGFQFADMPVVSVRLQRRKRSLSLQDKMRACRGREGEEDEEEGQRGQHTVT